MLKWVGLVFAAGFIGYFGRYLSMAIIQRMRRRKSVQATAEQPGEIKTSPEKSMEQQKIKLEKKKAKTAAKGLKKTKKRG